MLVLLDDMLQAAPQLWVCAWNKMLVCMLQVMQLWQCSLIKTISIEYEIPRGKISSLWIHERCDGGSCDVCSCGGDRRQSSDMLWCVQCRERACSSSCVVALGIATSWRLMKSLSCRSQCRERGRDLQSFPECCRGEGCSSTWHCW
jgi:hypothetical protein